MAIKYKWLAGTLRDLIKKDVKNPGNGIDDFPGYFHVSCVHGKGYHLCIMRRAMVIGLTGFFLSLRTIQYPRQQLAEPGFQLLGILGRKGFRLL